MLEQRMHRVTEVGTGNAGQRVEFGMADGLDGRCAHARHGLLATDREVLLPFRSGPIIGLRFILRRALLQQHPVATTAAERGEAVPHR